MWAMRAAVITVGVLAAATDRADAECVSPSFNGTVSSSVVPTRGVLFVYDEDGRAPEVSWNGDVGQTALTTLTASVAGLDYDFNTISFRPFLKSTVTRIDYEGPAGSLIVVNRRSYQLASDWQPPSQPPRVASYAHHQNEWMCSSTDVLVVDLDQPTAAIRARWTYRGTTTEWVLPAREGTLLQLGKIDCGGTTLRPEELLEGGHLELLAIRLDGSEMRVVGLPETIAAGKMPQTGSPEEPRWDPRSFLPPPDAYGPMDLDHEPRGPTFAMLALLLALSLGLPRYCVAFARHTRT